MYYKKTWQIFVQISLDTTRKGPGNYKSFFKIIVICCSDVFEGRIFMLMLSDALMKRTFNLQKKAQKVLLQKGPKFMRCQKRMEDISIAMRV